MAIKTLMPEKFATHFELDTTAANQVSEQGTNSANNTAHQYRAKEPAGDILKKNFKRDVTLTVPANVEVPFFTHTAVEDGVHHLTAETLPVGYTGPALEEFAINHAAELHVRVNGGLHKIVNMTRSGHEHCTAEFCGYLAAGDTVEFSLYQRIAVAVTATGPDIDFYAPTSYSVARLTGSV